MKKDLIQNTKATPSESDSLQTWLSAYRPAFANALPKMITVERFTRMAKTALTTNPALKRCSPSSFIAACLTSAQLGLEPNTPLGQAYLVPFGKECTLVIGYQGYLDLAYRTDMYKSIMAQIVYENDKFEYEFGLEPKLKHIPSSGDRGAATFCYAVYKMVNGGYAFEVMSINQIREHARKKVPSYNNKNSAWQTDFEAMAKKTLIKRVLKLAPKSTELRRATEVDGASFEIDVNSTLSENEELTPEFTVIDEDTGEITEDKEQNISNSNQYEMEV